MGCWFSSPHAVRRYRDPADFDEEFVSEEDFPLRTFGKYRSNQVLVPDDIDGLPSSREDRHLATHPHILLYEAEIDNGRAWRCLRPCWGVVCLWPVMVFQVLAVGGCSCDEIFLWVRKEYSTRTYYRVYPNRIEINEPRARLPFGYLGCGSWNGDNVLAHPFDRGAFGFRRVQSGSFGLLFCFLPCNGDVIARQRCQCNGPVWHGGWWCDEWPCDMLCCSYRYQSLADGDEAAFASNLALQAYFEGRKISPEDVQKCLEYWRQNVAEYHDPVNRKRDVLCEPFRIPCFPFLNFYRIWCQRKRTMPFQDERATRAMKEAYENYERLRQKQIHRFTHFKHPTRLSTVCRAMGCRRMCGRKGLIFCTEGCNDNTNIGCCYKKLDRQPDDPFPPQPHMDLDDKYDATFVLQTVLGDPPRDVVYKRWEQDPTTGSYSVLTHRATARKVVDAEEPTLANVDITNHQNGTSQLEVSLEAIQTEPLIPADEETSTDHQNGTSSVEEPDACVTLLKGDF